MWYSLVLISAFRYKGANSFWDESYIFDFSGNFVYPCRHVLKQNKTKPIMAFSLGERKKRERVEHALFL